MAIASNSPHSASCAHPALPTCSSPSWATRPARPKEQPDEYPIECRAGVFAQLAGNRDRALVSDAAPVLVDTTRNLGEPFHLCRATGHRRRLSARLRDQRDLAAEQHA